jgi:hypothetical protein
LTKCLSTTSTSFSCVSVTGVLGDNFIYTRISRNNRQIRLNICNHSPQHHTANLTVTKLSLDSLSKHQTSIAPKPYHSTKYKRNEILRIPLEIRMRRRAAVLGLGVFHAFNNSTTHRRWLGQLCNATRASAENVIMPIRYSLPRFPRSPQGHNARWRSIPCLPHLLPPQKSPRSPGFAGDATLTLLRPAAPCHLVAPPTNYVHSQPPATQRP